MRAPTALPRVAMPPCTPMATSAVVSSTSCATFSSSTSSISTRSASICARPDARAAAISASDALSTPPVPSSALFGQRQKTAGPTHLAARSTAVTECSGQ
eukprot:CAMPEP_0181219146 /NCGR_PEP_ID=MMETSP1096-20121128/28094_1 /TAXON_ID=156174 ORGANISM="Chrysochromulina ericina, Strain CCMP281" /NCGR_SAMPLE_ID=MMETSP1096 /ASSEMBLY_ACC=CAM_ASM_000453 /LENGTH=99 /DNA_ID=CAMNT_0023311455 /DNA_START=302 /DNA_END=601 /DNA_ORIENTATION=-